MALQNDLTQGGVFRRLTRYAIPLVLSNILQATYGVVDMIVAGRCIGSAGLSGITNANTVISLVTQIIFGLCNGGCILVGQYFGAGEKEETRRSARTLYSMGLMFGVVFAALLFFFSDGIMALLRAPASEEAVLYNRVCAVGFLFVAGYNAAASSLRAIGNSRAPLVCIASTAVVNIALDILFVVPLKMGVFGAALATAISQAASFIVATVFIVRSRGILGIRPLRPSMNGSILLKELKLGVPCAVQQSVATISWLSVTFLFNAHGVAVSAGSGVSSKIKEFGQLLLSATATAASGMTAQNIGAGEFERARKTLYTAIRMTLCIAVCEIGVAHLFGESLVSLFTRDRDTALMACANLRIEIIGQLWYACILVYHAFMIGTGRPWYAFISSFINCIIFRVTLAFTLDHFFGVSGLFWACMIAPASSIPFGLWFERSGKWKKTLVRKTR